MLEGKFATPARKVLEPFQSAEAPRRLTNTLEILRATEGQASQPSSDGAINGDDVPRPPRGHCTAASTAPALPRRPPLRRRAAGQAVAAAVFGATCTLSGP